METCRLEGKTSREVSLDQGYLTEAMLPCPHGRAGESVPCNDSLLGGTKGSEHAPRWWATSPCQVVAPASGSQAKKCKLHLWMVAPKNMHTQPLSMDKTGVSENVFPASRR